MSSKEAETVNKWSEDMLLNVVPETEESARKYLGAANTADVSQEVVEHFADCVWRLKE